MAENHIPFELPGFRTTSIETDGASLTIQAQCTAASAPCPQCGVVSAHVHSHYQRRVRDLPISGRCVRLALTVRRFRCRNDGCPRQIFVERVGQVVAVYSQRTTRLTENLRVLSLSVGGAPGSRLSRHLGMAWSARTLLRVCRQTSLPVTSTPRVLGVDDWAFKRGQCYGTLLVNLETHQAVELLPDRTASTLAVWLKGHPGVAFISRDRAGSYADGARQGAPAAIQIADRWHLFRNLHEALAASYSRYQRLLTSIAVLTDQPAMRETAVAEVPPPDQPVAKELPARQRNALQQARDQRRAEWQHQLERVHQLRQQGVGMRAIARQLGLARSTVRKYSRLPELPKKTSPKPGPRLLDPYRAYLRQRLQQTNGSTPQFLQELRLLGYTGGSTILYMTLRGLRHELGLPPYCTAAGSSPPPQPVASPLIPRTLAAVVLLRPENRTTRQQQLLAQATALHPDIQLATHLAEDFARLLRQHDAAHLDDWLMQATTSRLPALIGFAAGLSQDYSAVHAALTYPWSTGPVEGHVNRLKLIKRMMFGRAKFDLLRLRVLYPT